MSRELFHFGVLGMKWGVRRYQNDDGSLTKAGRKRYSSVESVKTKSGDTVHILKKKSKSKTDDDYDLVANGKRVGELYLENHGDDLYVNWISIRTSQRGKGYASSVMNYVVSTAERNGKASITLEVPDSSPDARHIYEKYGFKASGKTDEYGLTAMKREVNKRR